MMKHVGFGSDMHLLFYIRNGFGITGPQFHAIPHPMKLSNTFSSVFSVIYTSA
jgi:hypothetical protein